MIDHRRRYKLYKLVDTELARIKRKVFFQQKLSSSGSSDSTKDRLESSNTNKNLFWLDFMKPPQRQQQRQRRRQQQQQQQQQRQRQQ